MGFHAYWFPGQHLITGLNIFILTDLILACPPHKQAQGGLQGGDEGVRHLWQQCKFCDHA